MIQPVQRRHAQPLGCARRLLGLAQKLKHTRVARVHWIVQM